MSREIQPTKRPTLEAIQRQFEHWRETRPMRRAIPEELWEAAISLVPWYPLYRISRTLRLNYTDLKRRLERSKREKPAPTRQECSFVEVTAGEMLCPGVEWAMELENTRGPRLKMTYRGPKGSELVEMARMFWEETR